MLELANIELPSPPQTAIQLIRLCGHSESTVRDIVDVIAGDAALSARFLRVANAPFYGQQYEVSTLTRAAVVLGVDHVKVVALGFHLAELSTSDGALPDILECHWQGNLLRACVARRIAASGAGISSGCSEEAFLIGLLQDFAIPLIVRETGDALINHLGARGLYSTAETIPVEEMMIGTNHAHLAGRILDQWRLPPVLTFALTNHHIRPQEEPAEDKAMALWQIAYWVGSIAFREDRETAPVAADLRDFAYSAFGLESEGLGHAFYEAISDYESLTPVFGEMLPVDVDGANLMRRAGDLILDIKRDTSA